MDESTKNRLSAAFKSGFVAFKDKEKNIQEIFEVLKDIKEVVEFSSKDKISVVWVDSQIDVISQVAIGLKLGKNHPNYTRLPTQVVYFVLKENKDKKLEWTTLEVSSEGFPCTIYVDGNRVTASGKNELIENFESLLSSASTAEIINSLEKIAE